MRFLTKSELLAQYHREFGTKDEHFIVKSLLQEARAFDPLRTYDIFLSHAYKDAELIFALKHTLENNGYRVYVDWIEDKHLSRDKVSKMSPSVYN